MSKRSFTYQQIEEMRIMRERGASLKEIQVIYGGHLSTISLAVKGTTKPHCTITEVLRRLDRIERMLMNSTARLTHVHHQD